MAPSRTDLAWAAGFLDGEGHIGLHYINDRRVGQQRSGRLMPRIVVGQRHRAPLDLLASWFGGNVRLRKPADERSASHFAWELQSARAVHACLTMVMPFLRLKLAEAEQVDALCARTLAWRQGARLTDDEISARNRISEALHAAKVSPRSQYARRVAPQI